MWIKAASLAAGLAGIVAVLAWQHAERTRTIEGTWLFMFEGSELFEQRLAGKECDLQGSRAGWLNYHPRAIYPNFDTQPSLPSSGTYRSNGGEWSMDAFEVRFEGRKRLRPMGAGHMGMSKSEYEVDRMLSVKPIPGLICDVR